MTSVLLADIGGTNARFALADAQGLRDFETLKVADYPGPAEAVRDYLKNKNAKPARAVFAVAGPVGGDDEFSLTNFDWKFSISAVRDALDLADLELVNDFYAQAMGILEVDASALKPLGGGKPVETGNIAVLGPGTGLGVATLIYDSKTKRYLAVAGEGGHVTIPTLRPREFAVVEWLLANKYTHVSAERVCSGKGLVNLYDALGNIDGASHPARTPEEIAAAAQDGSCALSAEALTMMLGFLGRIAGNLALTFTTTRGVYFTGGILPKLDFAYLQASRLRGEFIAKGRNAAYVDSMPSYIVDDPVLALRGLRAHALGRS